MPAEIDGNRAMYARKPAWHKLGIVKPDGWFTADEAMTELGMDEEVVLVPVMVEMRDRQTGELTYVASEDLYATVQWSQEEGRYRIHGAGMTQDYGVVQARTAFRFMDEVVGAIGGAHYETVGNLRKGRQVFMTIDTGAINLDPQGRNDLIRKYILGTNSFDRSLAFRVKFTNIRVECANMLAMALRGSGDQVVAGDWSTKHTKDILDRVAAAKMTLGLYNQYETIWAEQAQTMIEAPMNDDSFARLLKGLYEYVEKEATGLAELTDKSKDAMVNTKILYELGPASANIYGTLWGGLQAITEDYDWAGKVRGGRNTNVNESRFRRQMQDGTGVKLKDVAWDMFYKEAQGRVRPVSMAGVS